MKLTCPHCNQDSEQHLCFDVPKEQSIAMKITSQSPMFEAETIGKTILEFAKLLTCVARDAGSPIKAFVHSITLEQGSFEVRLALIQPSEKLRKETQPELI